MKKILSILSIFTFLFVSIPTTFSIENKVSFEDVDIYDDYLASISYLKENKIVNGYDDGSFKPESKITRDEFAKIIIGAITDTDELNKYENETCFPDVKNYWAVKYVCYAKDKNIIRGNNGFFYPKKSITLPEATKIILKAFSKIENPDDTKEDWYSDYLSRVSELNALPPTIQNAFVDITRGEMAEMIMRIKNNEKNDFDSMDYDVKNKKIIPKKYFIDSCEELKEKINNNYPMPYAEGVLDDGVGMALMKTANSDENLSAEYSSTNVQVEGIDESDIVKNDGKYIYKIRNSMVDIIQAYPATDMKKVSTIEFEDGFNPESLYNDINNKKLIVIGNYSGDYNMTSPYSNKVKVKIFDLNNIEKPILDKNFSFDGQIKNSRKSGNDLYFVIEHNFWYGADDDANMSDFLPTINKNGKQEKLISKCSDIQYFPNVENGRLISVIKLGINNGEINKKSIIGNSDNIYMSKNSLYLASTIHNFRMYMNFIRDSYIPDVEKTVIHKFSLSDGIEYKGRGKVKGRILNQFSMDENDNNFRIATTIGNVWDSNNKSTNNLYILNDKMKVIGRLEGLAKGERIYSTRFLGNTLYMVTFKKTDPLFVIDLKDPKNPTLRGKLKIPGYSDYLHPYDENHLIGFGKDAVSEENQYNKDGEDFVWYQGMKLSLFDVTDIENPKEMFTEYIGDRGTDSELLRNHKALFFDKKRNLISFPITVTKVEDRSNGASSYGKPIYQGAFVYNLSLDKGFQLKKKITHQTNYDSYKSIYNKNIKRILSIGNNIYTISDLEVKANDIKSFDDVKTLIIEDENINNYNDKEITY